MDESETTVASPRHDARAYRWKVLTSVIFGAFMVILDTTAVNVAFRTLQDEYAARLTDTQWVISLYVLSLGIITPLSGFLADRFGIKRVYLSGLAIFVFGSLLCGLAPSLPLLIAARMLQGVGGGIALPLGTAQLLLAFPSHEQGRALGLFGIVIVFAPALGPLLGGWLVDLGLWRWIFFINLPIGGLGLVLGSRFLREVRTGREHRMDWPGLVTEMIGFGAVLYAASLAELRGWGAPDVLGWFALGAAGLAAFTYVELFVAREPLLDLRLFARNRFLIASMVGYVSVIALFGAEFLLPVYLQVVRGRTAFETGLTLLPMAVAAGIATPTAGWLYDRIGPRVLLATAFTLLAINTWQFASLDGDTPIPWIMALLFIRGTALGFSVQTTFVTALSVVSGPALPRATSLVNATRNVMQSIGVALLATTLAAGLSPRTRAVQHAAQMTGAGVCASMPGRPRPEELAGPLPDGSTITPDDVHTACDESVAGFSRAYHVTFVAALIALALGVLLPGWPGAWAGRPSFGHGGT